MSKDDIWLILTIFFLGVALGGCSVNAFIKSDAKASGVGEYYPEHDNKKWRWK